MSAESWGSLCGLLLYLTFAVAGYIVGYKDGKLAGPEDEQ